MSMNTREGRLLKAEYPSLHRMQEMKYKQNGDIR